MATRIDPKLSEGGHSVFDQRSEHGQFLLSDYSPTSYQNQDSFSRINDLCGVSGVNKLNDVKASAPLDAVDHIDDIDHNRIAAACDPKTLESFFALFPHRNESGVRYSDFSEWRGVSRFHVLTDEEILATVQMDSNLRRAVRFDTATRMQALRISRDSKYFNRFAADLLKKQFAGRGIPIKQYQYNNEWFFFVFFSECVDPAIVSAQMTQMLSDAGFTLSSEDLAIVQGSDLLPLPVQPGFSWISERGAVSVNRDEISLQGAIALFLSDVTRNGVTFEEYMLRMKKRSLENGRDFSSTTITLLESIGLNINKQDGISCFTVFESAQPKAYATTIAIANSSTRRTIPIRKVPSAKLELDSGVDDADYLRKLGQALRHP
jgi:hypothetical protein